MSLKLIEAQVSAGTKPGSDLELARANWNEARIASQMASENLATIQSSLSAFGLDTSTLDSSSITNAIPSRLNLVETDLLEQRAAATITKLSAERRMASASGQADISMVLRSQNFTRNFTPNDRGFAVQLSIPIDHGSIRSSVATIESQISSFEMRMKDDRSKQNARRKSIETTIASIETAIANTQQSVITPMTDYVAKMKRAYTAGTVTVTAYLDAQRSLHESIHKLITLRDQRDQLNVQLIEQGGMLPKLLVIHNKQSDRK
jgi:outer membrane protein TolC